MATIGKDSGGKKRILFVAPDGKRKTLRIGKCSVRDAELFRARLESLLSSKVQGLEPSRNDAEWLNEIGPVLRSKLVNVGLCRPVEDQECPTVSQWIYEYISSRSDVKKSTIATLTNLSHNLKAYAGDKTLKDFTAYDAEKFRIYLHEQGLALATCHRRCRTAKQIFSAAVKARYISQNPFDGIKTSNHASSKERMQFITRDEIEQVIEACPNTEWRLIFALARYGGLRIPSEIFSLKWSDILWDKSRFIVRSSKTAHIGKESRIVPIFPELLPYLREAFENAPDGSDKVITLYDENNQNLRTQATKIIERAGLEVWPKIFQNLRSSRETELAENYPIQAVCSWIGNTPEVARKHYLQVTEEHFKKAAQNPAQYMRETACNGSQGELGKDKKKAVSYGNCETLRNASKSRDSNNLQQVGRDGFEPSKAFANGFTARPL